MVPSNGALFAGVYRVEGVLGQGAMGRVLAARAQDGRPVAIKVLLGDAAKQPEIVERFLREARAASRIRGPNVARVYDVQPLPDGTPYIVMERLEGSDLQSVIHKRGPIPIPIAIDWVLEGCEAIAEAHQQSLIHRDLKPANLFLARVDGVEVIKVLDFGISKSLDNPSGAALSMTKTSSILGSPLYMSPEQLKNAKDVDERTDIWSLGVILFELIAGVVPFSADTFAELSAIVLSKEPSPVLLRAPPELQYVVAGALAKRKEERFGGLSELASALAPFGSERGRASAERIIARLGEAKHTSRPSFESLRQTAPLSGSSLTAVAPSSGLSLPTPVSSMGMAFAPATPPSHRGRLLLGAIAVGLTFSAITIALLVIPRGSTSTPGARLIAPPQTPSVDSAPLMPPPTVPLSTAEAAPSVQPAPSVAVPPASVRPARPPSPLPHSAPKDLFGNEN